MKTQSILLPITAAVDLVECLHRHRETDPEAERLLQLLLAKLQAVVDREQYAKEKGYR